MQLMIIRHGQSANNLLHEQTRSWVGRVPDPGLTPLGHEQAAQLGEAFASGGLVRPNVLISSLMLRAVQTSAPLADALDLPLEGHLELNEVLGVHAGNPREPEEHRGSPASVLTDASPRLRLPEGAGESGWYDRGIETPAGAVLRAEKVVADLVDRYGASTDVVAIVCHEWISQYLLRAAIGLVTPENSAIPWFRLNNTGTMLLEMSEDDVPPTIVWTNRTDHLRPDQLTL